MNEKLDRIERGMLVGFSAMMAAFDRFETMEHLIRKIAVKLGVTK